MVSTSDFSVEKKNTFLCILVTVCEFITKTVFFLERHATAQQLLTSILGDQNGIIFYLTICLLFPANLTEWQSKILAVSSPGTGNGCCVGWMDPLIEEVTGFSVKPFQEFENTFSFEREVKRLLEISTFWRCLHQWWIGRNWNVSTICILGSVFFIVQHGPKPPAPIPSLGGWCTYILSGCPGQQQVTLWLHWNKSTNQQHQVEKHSGKMSL